MVFFAVIFAFFLPKSFAHQEFKQDPLSIKLYAEVPGYSLELRDLPEKSINLKLAPNLSGLTGFRLSYLGFISLGYGFKSPLQERELLLKGKTRYEDYRFNLAFKGFYLGLNHQSYQGFFIENSGTASSAWVAGEPFLQLSDLKLQSTSANLTWIWAPEKFSVQATLDQTVRQEKSGGSVLLGAAIVRTQFGSPTPFLPAEIQSNFGEDRLFQEGSFLAFTVKGGYAYTFVWDKKWFTSVLAQLGGGQKYRKYRAGDTTDSSWAPAYKLDALLAVGFNGDRMFTGISLMGDSTSYSTRSIEVSSGFWAVNLYLGLRL